MNRDPVITEIRKAKETIATRFNCDVRKLAEELIRRQAQNPHRLAKIAPRRTKAA
mgnify:CR=1 FL=1